MSRDKSHAKVAYDWYGSWSTLYNLYADKLLRLNLVPSSVSIVYLSILSSIFMSSISGI